MTLILRGDYTFTWTELHEWFYPIHEDEGYVLEDMTGVYRFADGVLMLRLADEEEEDEIDFFHLMIKEGTDYSAATVLGEWVWTVEHPGHSFGDELVFNEDGSVLVTFEDGMQLHLLYMTVASGEYRIINWGSSFWDVRLIDNRLEIAESDCEEIYYFMSKEQILPAILPVLGEWIADPDSDFPEFGFFFGDNRTVTIFIDGYEMQKFFFTVVEDAAGIVFTTINSHPWIFTLIDNTLVLTMEENSLILLRPVQLTV
jgi:hypothetical protein